MVEKGIQGNIMKLTLGGRPLLCEIESSFDYDINMLATSARTQGGWKEYVPEMVNWKLSTSANVILRSSGVSIANVINAGFSGERVDIVFKTNTVPNISIRGEAVITSHTISAQAGTARSTIVFQGVGAFSTDFINFGNIIINAMPRESNPGTIFDTRGW